MQAFQNRGDNLANAVDKRGQQLCDIADDGSQHRDNIAQEIADDRNDRRNPVDDFCEDAAHKLKQLCDQALQHGEHILHQFHDGCQGFLDGCHDLFDRFLDAVYSVQNGIPELLAILPRTRDSHSNEGDNAHGNEQLRVDTLQSHQNPIFQGTENLAAVRHDVFYTLSHTRGQTGDDSLSRFDKAGQTFLLIGFVQVVQRGVDEVGNGQPHILVQTVEEQGRDVLGQLQNIGRVDVRPVDTEQVLDGVVDFAQTGVIVKGILYLFEVFLDFFQRGRGDLCNSVRCSVNGSARQLCSSFLDIVRCTLHADNKTGSDKAALFGKDTRGRVDAQQRFEGVDEGETHVADGGLDFLDFGGNTVDDARQRVFASARELFLQVSGKRHSFLNHEVELFLDLLRHGCKLRGCVRHSVRSTAFQLGNKVGREGLCSGDGVVEFFFGLACQIAQLGGRIGHSVSSAGLHPGGDILCEVLHLVDGRVQFQFQLRGKIPELVNSLGHCVSRSILDLGLQVAAPADHLIQRIIQLGFQFGRQFLDAIQQARDNVTADFGHLFGRRMNLKCGADTVPERLENVI